MTALAMMHVAKRDLGLDDDTYRAVLVRVTGKRSSKDMTDRERQAVLDEFVRQGFKPGSKSSGKAGKALSGPYAKKAQALWIALWNLGAVEDKRDSALLAFVCRQTGIERTEWILDAKDGRAIIEALKSWCAREGVDWEVGTMAPDHARRNGFQIALAQWEKLRPQEIRTMDKLGRTRAGYTVSFPVGAPRSKGAMGLAAPRDVPQEAVDAHWQHHSDALLALTHIAHFKLSQLPLPVAAAQLTPRQRECLQWIADGKTQADITQITGMAASTVERHLSRARDHLRVETTAQAIAKLAFLNQLWVTQLDEAP